MHNKSCHIAVVGAGLLGRLLTLLLAEQHKVTLFEKSSLNNEKTTGRLAAAMVAPIAESVLASKHIVDMGMHSLDLWKELLSTLGLNGLYQQAGTLVVAHPNDDADLNHFHQRLKVCGAVTDGGLTQDTIKPLDNIGIQAIEPELQNTFNHGLFLANEGHVLNHQLYDQTQALLQQSNIHLMCDCDARVKNNRVVYLDNHTKDPDSQKPTVTQYDLVIDCRGINAKHQLQNPGAKLRGVRGEVIRLKAPEVSITRPVRFMHPRYPIYIVPKPNNEYVIGATEIESEDEKQPSVRSTMELLSAAYSLHKGFSEAEILSIEAGLRPTLMDNEPEISVSNGLIQANGLYRHGYLIAPYMLAQILMLMNQQGILTKCFSDKNLTLDESLISRFG